MASKIDWVLARDVSEVPQAEFLQLLRGYRPSGLWEFRNGEVWVNLEVLENPDEMNRRSVLRGRSEKPVMRNPIHKKKPIDVPHHVRAVDRLAKKNAIVRWEGSELGLARRQKGAQYVYIVTCKGYVKIGVARWPEKRLTVMQGGNPFPMALWGLVLPKGEKAFALETELHSAFSPFRVQLEWFSGEVLELLGTIKPDRVMRRPANLTPIRDDIEGVRFID